jgi:hypothetical protein
VVPVVLVVVEEEVLGLGELEAEAGPSRLGREEEVGVMEELVRRGKGPGRSRGEAMVDIVVGL